MHARNIPFLQIRFFEPGYYYHIVPPWQLSSKLLDYLLALVSLSKGWDGCETGKIDIGLNEKCFGIELDM
jgi:hypothetical protein